MPNFRKGLAPEESRESKGSGQFPGFVRSIQWTKDKEEKFIVFLNPASEIPTVELHTFIPVGTWKSGKPRFDEFISRTDPGIGESSDDLTDRLGRKASKRDIAVAVELEPTYTTVNGRKRPTGFAVKTETFERRVEGGGTEEVEAPVIGPVVQARKNFFGWVASFDAATNPIEDTPLQVIRRGKDQDTVYDFTPFMDQEIDYSNLIEFAGNINYLRDEELDLSGDPKEAALRIGKAMLDKRLDELSDGDRYERLVTPITYIEDRFGSSDPKPAERTQRPSPRPVASDASEPTGNDKFDRLRRMHEPA